VTLTVEDDGPPFDPLAYPQPDLDAELGERLAGGLGIHLVRRLMDDVVRGTSIGRPDMARARGTRC
jgi:serine/threonine-protein kinase RsbW